jgi:hypothetical protein
LEESNVEMASEDITFLEVFNRYQLSTRYPDYLRKIEKLCTKELNIDQLDKVKDIRLCLLKMLQ